MMARRWALRVVAALSIGSSIGAVVADAVLGWPTGWFDSLYAGIVVVFAVVGWLIAERRPGNVVGPLLLLFAFAFALYLPSDLYVHQPGSPPGAAFAALFNSILDAPMFILLALVLIVFPDGQPPSPRWRPLFALAVVGILLPIVGSAIDPNPMPIYPDYTSPFAIPGVNGTVLVYVGYVVMLTLLVAAAAALAVRWRRGDPVERAQIKWVVAAALLMLLTEIVNVATFEASDPNALMTVIASVAIALVPIAMGVAILRYRLYEIDRVISRTIAYALVTGILASVFAAAILLLQGVLATFTQGQTVAVAASTLAVLALFQPVRRWVQRIVDRRFDRARYDAEQTATAFSDRLRHEVDMETVTRDLRSTVRGALAPTELHVWVRGGRR